MDVALQTEENYVGGFQGRAVPYHFNDMPEHLDLESFIAGWNGAQPELLSK